MIGWFVAAAVAQEAYEGAEFGLPVRKDHDQDGVRDALDQCPDASETWNHVDDGDGCPDGDGSPLGGLQRVLGDDDGDGLPTNVDLCPSDAEDVDAFQDTDGCPDPDNDADGVPDTTDRCPNEPGGPLAWDLGGCPPAGQAPAPQAPPPPQTPQVAADPRQGLPSVDGRLATGARHPEDAAVVVGLEDYAFVADVPHARRDAEAFATFLTYTRGIPLDRVRTVSSGSVEVLRQALDQAGKSVRAGGTVWVYFAGHGAASLSTGERVLLGDDVRPDPIAFDARTLPVGEVERLASAGGGRALLVLDTCYAGTGRGGQPLLPGRRFAVPAYAVASAAEAAQWTASAPDELSGPLDEVSHGAFTYLVVGALRGWADGELGGVTDGAVTADEARAFVGRALRTLGVHDQHPAWVGPAGDVVLSTATEPAPPGLR